jgi:hypothetical protein
MSKEVEIKSVNTGNYVETEHFSFSEIGDTLKGELTEIAKLPGKKPGTTFNKYVIKSSDGRHLSFLGNHDLDSKPLAGLIGKTLTISLKSTAPNPHGGSPMKQYKVTMSDDGNKVSAASVVAAARA